MAATRAGLGDAQVKPTVTLIWLLLGLIEASWCLFDRIWEPRLAILLEKQMGGQVNWVEQSF